MSEPTKEVTVKGHSYWDVVGAIVLGAALGLAGMMAVVCSIAQSDLAYPLLLFAFGGCVAAEIVELLGKEPAPAGLKGKKKIEHYRDSFNHARFWWRVASWSLLIAAGHFAVEVLKGDSTPTCPANSQIIWWDPGWNNGMLAFIIPAIMMAIVGGWSMLGRVKGWGDRQCRLMAQLRLHSWDFGLVAFAIAIFPIGILFFQDCTR